METSDPISNSVIKHSGELGCTVLARELQDAANLINKGEIVERDKLTFFIFSNIR